MAKIDWALRYVAEICFYLFPWNFWKIFENCWLIVISRKLSTISGTLTGFGISSSIIFFKKDSVGQNN